jgi:putative Holliday junction resolvase
MSDTPKINTLLCFDFGSKRIGVAVGQVITGTATPLTIIHHKRNRPDWERITGLVEEWKPGGLVVGMPLNMRGQPQAMSIAAGRFMRQLRGRCRLPVYDADERLSSFEATQRSGKKDELDAIAAHVILEAWFADNHRQLAASISSI